MFSSMLCDSRKEHEVKFHADFDSEIITHLSLSLNDVIEKELLQITIAMNMGTC